MSPGQTGQEASMADTAATFDAREYRRALGTFPTGVAVVTTRAPSGAFVGLTINSFSSLSLEPPLVLWALNLGSPSLGAFDRAQYFAVNILAEDQVELSRRFASPAHNGGDHVLFIGHVERFGYDAQKRPLVFFAGKYLTAGSDITS
jgi:flavin reductase (DIM6/NTAB) family NADH-FMN oxidoreductase RutF